MSGVGGVAGLLLAAGGGRRLGVPKALVSVGGTLLVERGLGLLRAGGCAPVVVVLGAAADAVRTAADLGSATVVENKDWREGLGSSLRAGLERLSADTRAQAAVVALVDQPLVRPEAVARLVRAWEAGARAAVATYGGEPRNPVLVARALWDGIARDARGDVGARVFLRRHPRLITPVACDDVASPADINTPADLERIARIDALAKSVL